jgi:hypothetical protein
MKRFMTGLALCGLAGSLLLAAPAAAQSAPSAEPEAAQPTDTLAQAGKVEGTTSAEAAGTAVWTVGGFAGGLTLGPIGAGLAYAMAESSASALPADVQSKVGRRGSEYSLAYQQAYTQKLISRRKRASLVGGAAGTALLVVGTVGMYLRLQ